MLFAKRYFFSYQGQHSVPGSFCKLLSEGGGCWVNQPTLLPSSTCIEPFQRQFAEEGQELLG